MDPRALLLMPIAIVYHSGSGTTRILQGKPCFGGTMVDYSGVNTGIWATCAADY